MTYSKKTGKAKRGRKTARATNARGIETLKARREKAYYKVWEIHRKLRAIEKQEDEARAEFMKLDKALKARERK